MVTLSVRPLLVLFVSLRDVYKRYVILLQSISFVWHLSFHFISLFWIAIFSIVYSYIFYFNPLRGLVLLHYSKWLQNIALIEDTCILLCWNIHVCNSIHNIILTYRIYLLLTDLRKTLNSCWIRFQQSRDTYRNSLQKIFVRSFETNINVQHFTLTLWYL